MRIVVKATPLPLRQQLRCYGPSGSMERGKIKITHTCKHGRLKASSFPSIWGHPRCSTTTPSATPQQTSAQYRMRGGCAMEFVCCTSGCGGWYCSALGGAVFLARTSCNRAQKLFPREPEFGRICILKNLYCEEIRVVKNRYGEESVLRSICVLEDRHCEESVW